jgi:hypothetical protein
LAGEKGAQFGAPCRGVWMGRKLARGYSAICYPGFTHPKFENYRFFKCKLNSPLEK